MLVAFDLDCGELVRGHHFVARGIAATGELPSQEGDRSAGGISFEYELVPGVEPTDDGGAFFRYLVGVEYSADVALSRDTNDCGAIAPFKGGASTHGSRGDWPLPAGARHLTFILHPSEDSGFQSAKPAGAVDVDLQEHAAAWRPMP